LYDTLQNRLLRDRESPAKEPPMLQNHPMYAYIPVRDLPRARAFYEQKVGAQAEAGNCRWRDL
jgi:hypothetical protein